MKQLEFDESSKLADILKKIQEEDSPEIEILTPPQVSILKTKLNKEVIRRVGNTAGKKIFFRDEIKAKKIETVPEQALENFGFVEGKDVAGAFEEKPTVEEVLGKKKRFPLPKIPFSKIFKGPKWLYFLAAFFGLVIFGLVFAYWYVPSATVTLFTENQTKDTELTLVASATANKVDTDKGIIPLEVLENNQEDVSQTKATGTRTIGTPAKGRVAIVNHDTAEKKYFAGTVITPTSGPAIQFTLDAAATVSASPPACTTNCSQTAVDVTAKTIGEEGNLPAGTTFRIGSAEVSLVAAKNDTNFTGGTKKNVTVISADDQKKAKEDLLKKMEEKAKKELEKAHQDIVIPEGGLEPTILEETYSNKVDEEVAEFRLSLKVRFSAKVFSKSNLLDLLIESISESLPAGYKVDREKSAVESEISGKLGDDLQILGKIKAELVPDIKIDEVRKNITGKSFSDTNNYLKGLGGITGFEIKINPPPFRIFSTMPLLGKRIEIKMEEKQ